MSNSIDPAPARRLGRVGWSALRTAANWWRASLQDVALTLIGLAYLILKLIDRTDGGPRPPSAPAASD